MTSTIPFRQNTNNVNKDFILIQIFISMKEYIMLMYKVLYLLISSIKISLLLSLQVRNKHRFFLNPRFF